MKKVLGLAFSLLMFTGSANAIDLGVGLKAGTVGAGIDISAAVTRTINVRVSLTNVDIEGESETITVGDSSAEGDLDAELDLDFGANALLFDWYPFDGTFHLTAGMMRHTGKVDVTGDLVSGITVDGQPLSPDDISGSIGGTVALADSYQPYIGFGFGRKAGYEPGFSVTLDVGVALLDPSVGLEATVNAGGTNGLNQAELDARLAELEGDAEADLDDFEAWPILAIGLNYAF